MSAYRIAVNVEWTSKCNARCLMCPRSQIRNPMLMRERTWGQVLDRLHAADVFRAVIAGYGEPTTHPRFFPFVDALRHHPVPFDMVSNGQNLDAGRLRHLDGAIGTLIISFSSVDPEVYRRVHINLDHARVMDNIKMAQRSFKHTRLAISLTPMAECLESLPATIAWLRAHGVHNLTMSPTLYNRAGSLEGHAVATQRLRQLIARHQLHSQELDFIPGARDIFRQWRANTFGCIPRNTDMLVAAGGDYLYCFNDINHDYPLGHVADMSLREALAQREKMPRIPALCDGCNLEGRYNFAESVRVGLSYLFERSGSRRHSGVI